ncbi:MAG: HAMP domain-containing sensor histidine kinase [Chitinophagaceae bacterium]
MKHAPTGMAEIEPTGAIIYLNPPGETVLRSLLSSHSVHSNNLFDQLYALSPEMTAKIREFTAEAGNTLARRPQTFVLPPGTEKQLHLTVNKISPGSIMVYFGDQGECYPNNKTIQQEILEKAIVQGKYEIAMNVLHDIGNAVVGLSSFISRTKRALELDNSEQLKNLVGFFETQRAAMSTALGEAKADAIVQIISGIAQTQKTNQDDIAKSVAEQQNIINHIQEILNMQRQYISGAETIEKKPTPLNSIINDCMSMLSASLTKRNIAVTQDVQAGLPLINGDRTQLMQVILNILKNSIEAIDMYAIDKSISISTSLHAGVLILTIRDNGKGFDEKTARHLFTRGFTTKSTGTGIGLDHCRAILEKHGGSIDITSNGIDTGAQTIIKFKI